jgi:hypothetical protein
MPIEEQLYEKCSETLVYYLYINDILRIYHKESHDDDPGDDLVPR